MASEHGHHLLTSQNILTGSVSIDPATAPTNGIAKIFSSGSFDDLDSGGNEVSSSIVYERPRRTMVSGTSLVVTLESSDLKDQSIWWWSV